MLKTTNLGTVEPKPVDWLWEHRIPRGMLTLLEGDTKEGKSLVTLDVAARLSTGKEMPLEEPAKREPSQTLILKCEDTDEVVAARLKAAGANPDLIEVNKAMVTIPECLVDVEARLLKMGATLLIVDPLTAFIAGSNTHSDSAVRKALNPLVEMAARLDVAVLAIRHFGKQRGGAAKHRGLGSTAFAALARSVLAVGRDPEDDGARILALSDGNWAQGVPSLRYRFDVVDGQPRIKWEGPCGVRADDLCAPPKLREEQGAVRIACEFLGARLANGEKSHKELDREAGTLGISTKSLQRARRSMGLLTWKEGLDTIWRLPDQTRVAQPAAEDPAALDKWTSGPVDSNRWWTPLDRRRHTRS